MSHHGDKGARYVAALYEARSNGVWDQVPELARKVEKHAASRRTLTIASRAGAIMYGEKNGYAKAEAQYGGPLGACLEQEDLHRDILDGLVTKAAMLYGTGQQELALRQIPETLHRSPPPTGVKGEDAWFAVCVLEGTLLRGLALESLGSLVEAGNTYRSIIAYVSRVVALRSKNAELCRWTEDVLSHLCVFFAMDIEGKPLQLGEAMAAFHLLSRFLDDQAWRPLGTRGSLAGHAPRSVWRAFYEALSRIVSEGLVYHPSPVQRDHETQEHRGLLEEEDFIASRVQQRADLRRVEVNYESLLLQDMHFPKANETNDEVKSWVELVMSNFRTLCGPLWTDNELGSGGKLTVGRTTLDILYRAATKTFHSTQILRHLFTIHCFLGEFDLAYKALDSYIEIITKGKAREERSGEAGLDLDTDEMAVRLASEAVRVGCRFGPDPFADQILSLGETLQTWLQKVSSNALVSSNGEPDGDDGHPVPGTTLSDQTASIAYCAIGLSQANFARQAFSPAVRDELRTKAIENLQQSVELSASDSACTESLYTLALLLAERRDLTGAIHFVKRALARPQEAATIAGPAGVAEEEEDAEQDADDTFIKERKLLPAWHLLVLLLCAREEFETASASCDAAFQQFGDATTLFGQSGDAGMSKQSLNPMTPMFQGLVDKMEPFEKQMLLEIKLTQVALLEIAHGSENAVNACNQLLALYARLFGKVDFVTTKAPRLTSTNMPSRKSGTHQRRPKPPKPPKLGLVDSWKVKRFPSKGYAPTAFPDTSSAMASRPGTQSGTDPRSLYDKRNMVTSYEKLNHRFSGNEKQYQDFDLRRSGTLKPSAIGSINSQRSGALRSPELQEMNEKTISDPQDLTSSRSPTQTRFVEPPPRTDSLPLRSYPFNGRHSGEQGSDIEKTVSDDAMSQTSPYAQRMLQSANTNDVPAPTSLFVKLQERRQKLSLLVKIWLFTAGMYGRASLYDDAKQAIDEADKLVVDLEIEVSKKGASVRNFQDQGWGGGKSVEDLWSDIYTERGKLYLQQSRPHAALADFEQALAHSPNNPRAIIELGTILLDIYTGVIPSEAPGTSLLKIAATPSAPIARAAPVQETDSEKAQTAAAATRMTQPLPPELYRLTARDRAYGLLSSLTKLGSGWDNAEAWYVLARAYEESGQVEEAKKALWWCVELEDTKSVRPWSEVSPGGYVL